MKPLVAFICVGVVGLAACSAPANEQLMTQCSGTFACSKNGDYKARMGLALAAQGDDCSTGYYAFHGDGTVTTSSSTPNTGTWTASAWSDNYKQFDFTVGTDSYSCHSAQLVTCVSTFQVTSDCDYNPGLTDTTCSDNVPPDTCTSSSWTNSGAYCDTFNDDSETAITGQTCADLGY